MILRAISLSLALLLASAASAQAPPYPLDFTPVPRETLSAADRAAGYALGSRGVHLYFVPTETGSKRGALIVGAGEGESEILLSLGPVMDWSGSGPVGGVRCVAPLEGDTRTPESATELVGLDVDIPYVGPDGAEGVIRTHYSLWWPLHPTDGSADVASELGGSMLGPRRGPIPGLPPEVQRCE